MEGRLTALLASRPSWATCPIVCGEELRLYSKAISKPMRYHEKRSLRCLENRTLLKQIATLLNR